MALNAGFWKAFHASRNGVFSYTGHQLGLGTLREVIVASALMRDAGSRGVLGSSAGSDFVCGSSGPP